MSKHPFHQFIDLIDFDFKIHAVKENIEALTQELKNSDVLVQQAADSAQQMKRASVDAHKTVDELELEMKDIDVKQKEKRDQLQDPSKYKEYRLLQRELESLQAVQQEKEAILLSSWSALELAKQKSVAQQDIYDEKKESLESVQRETQKKIDTLECYV